MGTELTMDKLDMLRRERLALAKLTDKQKLFCDEYCRSFDVVLALKAGGYYTPKQKGTSQAQLIQRNFERILESEAVRNYIALLKESVASRLGVSMDSIIDEYKSMAFTNMDDYVDWTNDGFTRLKSSAELTRAQKAGILEITETTTKTGKIVKIKLHNKQVALDRLFDVLKELEMGEKEKDGPRKISQPQVNLILQDPVARRAIEHLAQSMFDRQICLVATDKDQVEFNKHLNNITAKLAEANSGINGSNHEGAGRKRLPAPEGGGGQGADGGDHRDKDQAEEDRVADGETARESDGKGAAPDAAEVLEAGRYDIDGL